MTRYRISQGGEPIAFVASLGLAQEITRCEPPGFYRVDEIPVDPPIAERRPPDRGPLIRHSGGRRGREPGAESSREISTATRPPHVRDRP